jgi:CDP-glucose 4,6-dehydratase
MTARAEVWHRRRVLVTGCTGLLGTWLTEWLVERGADVVGLVRDTVPHSDFYRRSLAERIATVRGALEDYDLLERVLNEYEVEVVFHLAAQTVVGVANENPRSTLSGNVLGTGNVLEAARRTSRVRAVVVASSDKAYGAQAELPYREDVPLAGRHPYDVSKSCADLIAQAYWHTYRLPVGITRCGNFYGGGDLNFNRIVPGTIRSVLDGQPPIIRSDGTLVRDYFYIKDGVNAYALLAERLLGGECHGRAYNFSNELQVTVLDLTRMIISLMDRPDLEPIVENTARNEIRHQYLSAARARHELGWKPQYTLAQGLQETIDWYREFFGRKGSPR